MESRIRELAEPIAREEGADVLKVSLGGGGRTQLVRLVVDRAGGVDSDALERISRGLSLQLDVEDLIAGRYRLEVTSPGLDWPLASEADLARHRGEWIRIDHADGRSEEGENLGPEGEGFRFRDEHGAERRVALAEVNQVVRAVNWKRLPRKKKRRKRDSSHD